MYYHSILYASISDVDDFEFDRLVMLLNTAVAGTDGQSVTISYQLSSEKCLENGWTVWPPTHPSVYSDDADTHSASDALGVSDEILEDEEPLYKVRRHG